MPPETRPLLLPQNRKLRHLQGIYLRNLSFVRPHSRTSDDATLNKSPNKLGALRDTPALHHALSSESLRPTARRRRSTNLAAASPVTRQKKLANAIDSKVADVFFTLHCDGEEEPIYISETGERATNFNFHFFDLSHANQSVTRSSTFTIKIWAKRQAWTLLVEDLIDLRALHFLGSLQGHQFPPNGLIFHLIDGFYSLDVSGRASQPKDAPSMPTSSYNALMKLATLDSSYQDAIATKEKITAQINEILARTPANEVPQAEEKVALAKKYVSQQRRSLQASEKRRDELLASIKARRAAIAEGRSLQQKAEKDVSNAAEKLSASKTSLVQTQEQIHGQRRRICSDLADIYQIVPITMGAPLSFQICGLALPNTTYDTATSHGTDEDSLSGALGQVASLTNALQYYLSVPLPYPIAPFGSRATIRDDISLLTDLNPQHQARQRDFPLYLPRGGSTAAQFRFDYGWFLLNKDIEALCASQGLKVVDIRHTLPNLKYLLYVCSAGSDEVPERKRGGVRGLWAGRLKGRMPAGDDSSSIGGSRRGSADSELISRQRDELRKSLSREGPVSPGRESLLSTVGLPFDEGEMKLTLRTKGMRENVMK